MAATYSLFFLFVKITVHNRTINFNDRDAHKETLPQRISSTTQAIRTQTRNSSLGAYAFSFAVKLARTAGGMTLFWLAALYLVNTLLLIAVAIREVNRPVRALLWVVIGLVLPLVGFFGYLILTRPLRTQRQRQGLPPLPSQPATRHSTPAKDAHFKGSSADVAKAMQRIVGARPLPGQVQVLTNGSETYASLLKALRRAKASIDMEYYIFRDDHVGRLVLGTLLEKARLGVRVRFLRDGIGSRGFPKERLLEMAQAGIECKTFFPMRFPWLTPTVNHRDHRKIVVVDSKEAFVGGINVGDEYLGIKPEIGPWRDTHLRILGDPVQELASLFESNWQIAEADFKPGSHNKTERQTKPGSHFENRTRAQSEGESGNLSRTHSRRPGAASQNFKTPFSAANLNFNTEIENLLQDRCRVWDSDIQTVQSGPETKVQGIHQLFFLGLTLARHSVEITTPYFAPDSDIVAALKTAAMRGVRVRLLVPFEPDHKIIALACRTYYPELLEAGVEIYLYLAGVLHAKVMTLDEEFAIVGAANFDMRSFRLNYELCEIIYRKDVAIDLIDQFERDLQTSKELTLKEVKDESVLKQIREKAARILAQWL